MRGKMIGVVLLAALVTPAGVMAQQNHRADVEFQAALRTETVTGDLRTAIKQYESLTTTYRNDRAFVANVLVRMAEAYHKLGDAESKKIYERIVKQYGDQKNAVAVAQSRLRTEGALVENRLSFHEVLKLPTFQTVEGSIARDGRYIAYVDWQKNGNLFVRDLQSGNDRAVTDGATDRLPEPQVEQFAEEHSFSRDSKQLAYSWFRENGRGGRYELRLIDLRGDGVPQSRLLVDTPDIAWIAPRDWSPDGKSIAVHITRPDKTGQIGLVSVSDGSLRILRSVEWRGATTLLFSPDGKYLAYDLPGTAGGDQRDVFILAIDGSREIPAVVSPTQDVVAAWSNDGKRLLFTSDRTGSVGLWSVGFANGRIDGTPELIRRDIGQVSRVDLTDEGKVYVSLAGANAAGGDIHLSSVDFGDAKQITPVFLGVQSYLGSNRFPSWSADGKRLAYASVRGSVGSRHAVFGIRATDTGEVHEVSPSPALELVQSVTWSIDGALVVKGRDTKGVYGLYRVDPQNGRTSMLAAEGDGETIAPDGRISPDGKKFLYGRMPWSIASTAPPQPTRIWYEKDLTTGAEKEIARSFFGGVSPNGEYLGPLGDGPTRPKTLTVRSLNGSQVRELPGDLGGADVVAVRWATDSSAIYSLRRSGELWRFPMDGSEPRKVNLKLEGLTVTNFSIHPDGQQIAFETHPKQSTGPEIWVFENLLPR